MANNPLTRYLPLTAAAPSLQDNTADIDRLKKALYKSLLAHQQQEPFNLRIPFPLLGPVAAAFREANFKGGAVVNFLPDQVVEIVDFLSSPPALLPAMALDLGTTHLEATLLDLLTGDQLAHAHAVNQQIAYGADILSRIHHACPGGQRSANNSNSPGLLELQQAVLDTINLLAGELAQQCRLHPTEIRALTVSGNTTMIHLLLGLSPYHLCREPYTPLINAPEPLAAAELGLNLHSAAPVWILPSIGSYFGGDLISGIVASGLDQASATAMLIDVGTNAEVVLGNRDFLIACAGAAGPALEGGVARMGMRAAAGAVEHVRIDTARWELHYQTIDNAPAVGICGSGMIDLVAELFLARIIDIRGKFVNTDPKADSARRDFLCNRLRHSDDETSFVVVPAENAANGQAVCLGQVDLDAVMRSKAAMYAILTTLANQVGVKFSELERIYVAGAFGKHIDPRQAITLGMLPDLPLSTYEPIGNSSLRGAELILLDQQARERSMVIGQKITYVELNVNQEFMIRFSGSRFIPHTDPTLFPSVPRYF